jgi:hypothetical protein
MDQPPFPPRRRVLTGPIILICIGVIFLVANLVPSFNPWEILVRYWPVILILIGLGKVWDYYQFRRYTGTGGGGSGTEVSGIIIAVVLLTALLGLAVWRTGRRRAASVEQHSTQSIDLQGAKAVTANLQIPAGQLNIDGGSSHLVDTDFRYDSGEDPPKVNYAVSNGQGDLTLNESGDHFGIGPGDNQWDLHFNDSVPLDVTVQMGAGQGNLHMADLDLTHLEMHMGAGQVDLDLAGARRHDLSVDIQGGVGQARIKLPKDVGVRAHASGGIGSINVHGLTKDGDAYVNQAYGKTPTSIDVEVHGGIGEIDLDQQ